MSAERLLDDRLGVVLPVEILNEVLLLAALETSEIPHLLLICKTTYSWLLPILYHSISFTHSVQLSAFLSVHDIPDNAIGYRFSLIQNLYIGSSPIASGDLTYASSNWPLTVVSRILWLSTSLKRLTILHLDQNLWHRLEHVIPASLEHLTLGPVHGPFRPQDLIRRPQLITFTSISTYMRDDEVRDVVRYPSLRIFRRLIPHAALLWVYAIEQVKCIEEVKTLQSIELVFSGFRFQNRHERDTAENQLRAVTKDPRVRLLDSQEDYSNMVWREYEEHRIDFVVDNII